MAEIFLAVSLASEPISNSQAPLTNEVDGVPPLAIALRMIVPSGFDLNVIVSQTEMLALFAIVILAFAFAPPAPFKYLNVLEAPPTGVAVIPRSPFALALFIAFATRDLTPVSEICPSEVITDAYPSV